MAREALRGFGHGAIWFGFRVNGDSLCVGAKGLFTPPMEEGRFKALHGLSPGSIRVSSLSNRMLDSKPMQKIGTSTNLISLMAFLQRKPQEL